MGWTFPTNAIDISSLLTYGAAWNNQDISASSVPAGTNFVIMRVRNTGAAQYIAATRGDSGEPDRSAKSKLTAARQKYLLVKLDSSRVFSGYFEDSGLNVAVVDYSDDNASQFFATSTEKVNTGAGSFENVDVSAIVPSGGVAALVEIANTHATSSRNFALTEGGGGYYYYNPGVDSGDLGFLPLNGSRIGRMKVSALELTLRAWGYVTAPWTILSTPVVFSPSDTGWMDCASDNIPASATGVILTMINASAGTTGINVRKKGSSDAITTNINLAASNQRFAVVGLDSSGDFQAYFSSASDQYVVVFGYYDPVVEIDLTSSLISIAVPELSVGYGIGDMMYNEIEIEL